jgi:hypothetical protein
MVFALSASIANAAIEIEAVELGFNGVYKRNRWTPLQVVVTSQGEAFEGELRVETRNSFSGDLIQVYATPIELTRADRRRRAVYLFLPGASNKLVLKLVSRTGQVRLSQEMSPDLPKEAADLVALALTPERDVLSRWHGQTLGGSPDRKVYIAYADAGRLPAHWKGYDAVDFIALRGVSLTESQWRRGLLDWIQQGGVLLVSGGTDFHRLRGSFLEPFLPGRPLALETRTALPVEMRRFGFAEGTPFDAITITPEPGAQTLIGDERRIYAIKTACGAGRIISLAFDYNAPPFSESTGAAAFWEWLLEAEGKSPHNAEAQYEAYRRHEEKIQALLASRSSMSAPLVRRLGVFLLAYLLTLCGVTRWTKGKGRRYWLGGIFTAAVFSAAVFLLRGLVPGKISIDQFSALSVYPESGRGRLQTYMGLMASANCETSIQFTDGTFIRPLTAAASPPLQLVEGQDFRLRDASLDVWATRGYLAETFIDLPSNSVGVFLDVRQAPKGETIQVEHRFGHSIQNAWLIRGNAYAYLGDLPTGERIEIFDDPAKRSRLSFPHELFGVRKEFVQILTGEGVLRYLLQEESPKIVGWVKAPLLSMQFELPVDVKNETLLILYLPKEHRGLRGNTIFSL